MAKTKLVETEEIIETGEMVEEEWLKERLEKAANLLLAQFQPSIRGFAEEIADVVLKLPRWQLICGSLLAQYEGGSLPAPSIDPAWLTEGPEEPFRECEWCHEQFTPFKAFQRYCSNACGTAAINEAKKGYTGNPTSVR